MAGTIQLADKTYELRFTAYSLHRLAQETIKEYGEPKGLSYFIERLNGDVMPYAASYIIWAGLVWNYNLTPDAIARLLPLGKDLGKIVDDVLKAFSESVNGETAAS
jgi:hypothetical protein